MLLARGKRPSTAIQSTDAQPRDFCAIELNKLEIIPHHSCPQRVAVVAINSTRDRIHSLYILSTETKQVTLVWSVVHRVVTLCWDTLRYSCLSPDDKTLELLLLRHQKRGPHLAHSEKFILVTLVEQLHHRVKLQKAYLAHLVLILKPETLLRWHRELVRRKWTFGNSPKAAGRPPTDPHLVQLIL
jgi:hypothetical protein